MSDRKMDGRVIGIYVKEQKKLLGFCIVWIAIFFLLFSLSGISLKYIWYPALICAVLFFCYLIFDMVKFSSKHKELQRMKSYIDITLENLPEPETRIEQDYQELLETIQFCKNQQISGIGESRKETMEYVTLWTHQIKTPLTALQLLAADLEETQKAEVLSRLFEIEQYSDMMLQYIRLEGKVSDYLLKDYPVKSMVNQAVKYFSRIFISKGISVRIEIPEDVKVVTDDKWMVFVLKQLISNALKYTREGSITISMDGGETLIIEDTGIGIAGEDLLRIFERGYTGYNGRKDKKASGLGLFLVNQILQRLNHGIEIASEVGVGARVAVRLKQG